MHDTHIGKEVKFGKYFNKSVDDIADIEWIILDERDDQFLILSKYAIEAMSYHDEYGEVTWEKCEMRRWLNYDFYDMAFNRDEKASIVQVKNDNHDHCKVVRKVLKKHSNGTLFPVDEDCQIESFDTFDKVFLLSSDELANYRNVLKVLLAEPTGYVLSKGVCLCGEFASLTGVYNLSDKDYCDKWWLRNRGKEADLVCYSTNYDIINEFGTVAFYCKEVLHGVRPAIWVKKTAFSS